MVRRVAMILLAATLVVSAAACGADQGGGPRAPVGTTVMIHQHQNGKTLQVQPGDTLRFVLPAQLTWQVRAYPKRMMRLVTSPAGGRFEFDVQRPGAGKVDAIGVVPCAKGKACPGVETNFSVQVVSAWIP